MNEKSASAVHFTTVSGAIEPAKVLVSTSLAFLRSVVGKSVQDRERRASTHHELSPVRNLSRDLSVAPAITVPIGNAGKTGLVMPCLRPSRRSLAGPFHMAWFCY